MADYLCLECHTQCFQCATGNFSACLCFELQESHLKLFHNAGQPPAQDLSNDFAEELSRMEGIDLLYNADVGGSLKYGSWVDEQFAASEDPAFSPISPAGTTLNNRYDNIPRESELTSQPCGGSNNPTTSPITPSRDLGPAQCLTTPNFRRRDYTKEEKEEFELWMTDNPNPNKTQKAEYARKHALTEDQLKWRIHNRKRRAKTKELTSTSEKLRSLLAQQEEIQAQINILRSNNQQTENIPEQAPPKRKSKEDHIAVLVDSTPMLPGPVSLSVGNLRKSLIGFNEKLSYSSIEEYLKSDEEAVPVESIRRASDEVLPLKKSPRALSRQGSCYSSVGGPPSQDSSWDYGSVASTKSALSSAHSYASSASRTRVKKLRRQKHMENPLFKCSFCFRWFKLRKDLVAHEIDEHCLPQTFPCTFCTRTFPSMPQWEEHETSDHCHLQTTWFCMLDEDGEWDVEKCLFCETLLPTRNHYELAHGHTVCALPLRSRTFATRDQVMRHLRDVHDMREDEVELIKDELDIWTLKLDYKRNSGLWRCGYCGITGTNWSSRMRHIRSHWLEGGPRFTKLHPWKSAWTIPSDKDISDFRRILSKFGLDNTQSSLSPYGYEPYISETESSKVQLKNRESQKMKAFKEARKLALHKTLSNGQGEEGKSSGLCSPLALAPTLDIADEIEIDPPSDHRQHSPLSSTSNDVIDYNTSIGPKPPQPISKLLDEKGTNTSADPIPQPSPVLNMDATETAISDPSSHASLFVSLVNRSRAWFNFTKQRRHKGQH